MKMYAMRKSLVVLSIVALVLLLAIPSVGLAGPPDSATMVFGRPDAGNRQAQNKIEPGAVAISAGGTVTFVMDGFHQVAIYEPGIKPQDIVPAGNRVALPGDEGVIFIGEAAAPGVSEDVYTFNEPGKYLVICNVTGHFVNAQMWGWVIVN